MPWKVLQPVPSLLRRFKVGLGRPAATADGNPALVAAAPTVPLREIFRRFWPYGRPYRWWFLLTLVLVLLGVVIDTALVWMYKLLVDNVLVPRDFGAFAPVAIAYVALTVASGAVSFGDRYLSTWVSERFLLTLRTDFFRHLTGLSLDFFERRRLGDVISRLTGDVGAIESLVLSGVADILSDVLKVFFFIGTLVYLRWDLALLSLVVAPFFWLSARRFSRLIKQASREQRRRSGSISAVAEESLSNIALVQAYDREEDEIERFHRQNLGNFTAQMRSTRLKATFSPLVDLIELAGVILVVALGTLELSRGLLTLGGMLVFLAYLGKLYSPIRGLSRMMNTIHSASASAERIVEFLNQQPSVNERPNAMQLHQARGRVALDAVSFGYPGSRQRALDDVSFSVSPGETLALVGPSGAGKSTVAKLLLRFYDPTAGRVLLDGHDLRDLTLNSLRANVSTVMQETLVFDGTIAENIAYGRPGAGMEDVLRAAKAADAHDFILSMPDGYETIVGQKGRRLSGGQRQRIGIARAMVRNAPLLILDEPTTGLDAESAERILEPLRRLMSGRTTVIISHNLMTVSEASLIVVLEHGRVTERGTHTELLQKGGTYNRLYRLHAMLAEDGVAGAEAPVR